MLQQSCKLWGCLENQYFKFWLELRLKYWAHASVWNEQLPELINSPKMSSYSVTQISESCRVWKISLLYPGLVSCLGNTGSNLGPEKIYLIAGFILYPGYTVYMFVFSQTLHHKQHVTQFLSSLVCLFNVIASFVGYVMPIPSLSNNSESTI